ncbi:MAG: alpha/beta hydrolase [Flavobacteriaceae bacterium]|nr:alpha/beta hydrolase [Flavobacteriaceae bacterium]
MIYRGNKINYSIKGEGKCVVLLHGFLESKQIWAKTETFLSQKYKVINIDLLGHGGSSNDIENISMSNHSEYINDILEGNNIDEAVFIGHSMGGYIALAMAECFPYKIKGLCLVNSGSYADSDYKKQIRDRSVEVVESNKSLFVNVAVHQLFSKEEYVVYKQEIEEFTRIADAVKANNIIASIKCMRDRKDRTEILKSIKNKLMITGSNDSMFPLVKTKKEARDTNTELIVLDSGHIPQVTNSGELNDVLLEFCKKSMSLK